MSLYYDVVPAKARLWWGFRYCKYEIKPTFLIMYKTEAISLPKQLNFTKPQNGVSWWASGPSENASHVAKNVPHFCCCKLGMFLDISQRLWVWFLQLVPGHGIKCLITENVVKRFSSGHTSTPFRYSNCRAPPMIALHESERLPDRTLY